MTPTDFSARILAESEDGAAWEWTCPLRLKGWRDAFHHQTFGDELRNLLPGEFEIIQDMRTDTLIVWRVLSSGRERSGGWIQLPEQF